MTEQKATPEEKTTFEERLQSVQEIINRIEGGKLSLEDSVKQFESGMQTLAALDEELKGMARRLTVLRDGKEEPLPAGGNDEDL